MATIIGTKAIVVERTQTGTRTILGHVTRTRAHDGKVTHITVKGIVHHETIATVPVPINGMEIETRMIPLRPNTTHLYTLMVELLEWTDNTIQPVQKSKVEHWSSDTVDLNKKAKCN